MTVGFPWYRNVHVQWETRVPHPGAACLKQPRGIFVRGWGEGRIAWEKEKSPEFGPQKAEEASENPSPALRVLGWGGINMAVSDGYLRAALRSASLSPAFPSQQGFSLTAHLWARAFLHLHGNILAAIGCWQCDVMLEIFWCIMASFN